MVPCRTHCPTIDHLENGLSEARTLCTAPDRSISRLIQYQGFNDLPIARSANLEAVFTAGWALYRSRIQLAAAGLLSMMCS